MSTNQTSVNNITIHVGLAGNTADFVTRISVAKKSITIKNMLDDLGDDDGSEDNSVPITNITPEIFKKVLEYCEYIHDNPGTAEHVLEWTEDYTWKKKLDTWFLEYLNVPEEITVGVTNAANFLDIPSLLKMQCKYIGSLIKDKTPDELRVFFGKDKIVAASAASAASSSSDAAQ